MSMLSDVQTDQQYESLSRDDQMFMQRVLPCLDRMCTKIEDNRAALREFCQSPIEKTMADMLVACPFMNFLLRGPVIVKPGSARPTTAIGGAYICPQMRIGQYRVDFAILIICTQGELRVVVECDGHDFHEKTKEQAAGDKARDRYLNDQGYRVLRFTGSEIWNKPIECGEQITLFIVNEWQRGCFVRTPSGDAA
jgi:very-short-patch-repair endonuclease